MLQKDLEEIGLSEKEVGVYMALLAVEHASVVELSKKTDVKRSTIYPVLESLAKKGLISETEVDKKTYFQAEPPERLETFVERQKILLSERSKRLKTDIIPQLKSTQKEAGGRPVVKYFEGRNGIISISEEFFRNNRGGGTTYLMYPKDLLEGYFTKEEMEKYRKMRLNKKIRSKVIYTYKKGVIPSDKMGDRVKIDEKKYPISCDISVYEDKVKISILGKRPSGIFIESKELAETLKSLFDLVHDNLKKRPR